MAESCDRFLSDISPDLMPTEEKRIFFSNLQASVKSGKGLEELNKIADRLIEGKEQELSRYQKEAYQTEIAVADSFDKVMRFKDHSKGVMADLVGIWRKTEGSRDSTYNAQASTRVKYATKFEKPLVAENLLPIFHDINNELDLARALDNTDSVDNQDIRKIVQSYKETTTEQLNHQNTLGADIQFLDTFRAHITHNSETMKRAASDYLQRMRIRKDLNSRYKEKADVDREYKEIAYKRWKDTIVPRLDAERTFGEDFSEESVEETLRQAYEIITRGNAALKGGNLAEKISQHRFFHFKDSVSWMEYNREYGSGSVQKSMVDTINANSNRIAILERMGPNPDLWWSKLKTKVVDESGTPDIAKKLKKNEKYFTALMRRDLSPVNTLGANIGIATRGLINIMKLGSSTLSAIQDLAQMIAGLNSNGIGFLDRWGTTVKTFTSLVQPAQRREFLDMLGTWNEMAMGHFSQRFSGPDSELGFISKAQGVFFKLTGQHQWDESLRAAFGSTLARHLAINRGKIFKNLPEGTRNNLAQYGIKEAEWDLIRSNTEAMRSINGKMYIAPDSVGEYTEESIKRYLGKENASEKEIQKAYFDIEQRLLGYFLDQTSAVQMAPDAAIRAILTQGHAPGTAMGEIMRYMTQFKSYGANIMRNSVGRILLENSEDNLLRTLKNRNFSTPQMIEYIGASLVFGYVAEAARGLFLHGTVPDPTNPRTIEKSGLAAFGLLGDSIARISSQGDGTKIWKAFTPPSIDEGEKVLHLFKQLFDTSEFTPSGRMRRSSYHQRAERELYQFVGSHMPKPWYIAGAMKYLLNNYLIESADPGYIHRLNKRLEKYQKENGDVPLF